MTERTDEVQKPGTVATLVEERPASAASEAILQDIGTTRAALGEKLGALQDRMRMARARTKQILDLRSQAGRHPWALLGASVAAGFVAGSLAHAAAEEPAMPVSMAAEGLTQPPHCRPRTPRRDLLETLKLAVGAALMDLARHEIRRHLPAFGLQLDKVWEGRGLTSMSAAGALLDTDSRANSGEQESLTGNARARL